MPIGITRNLESWRFQDHHVERTLDNAAYTSAHPDDTLVLAGPARLDTVDVSNTANNSIQSLLAIGMLMRVDFNTGRQLSPTMAIGSGRSFFLSSKSQGSGSIQRLFVNGRNIMRVLYHNARTKNLPVEQLDDPAAKNSAANFYINLDSELYLIPLGLGTVFRTKAHDFVGGFYAELLMINSYSIGYQAGGSSVAESVRFVFDRLLPFGEDAINNARVSRGTLDAVIGFVDNTNVDVAAETLNSSTVSAQL